MTMSVRAGVIAIAAVALGLGLTGCGSDTKTEPSATESTASSEATSSPGAPSTSAQPAEHNYTIADYIRESGIVETPVKRGDPGSPTINLPMPPGWQDAGNSTPKIAYGMIFATDPAFGADPPTITSLLSKLTGNVDPAKIVEFAPGEIKNLPGYQGDGTGHPSELGGFDGSVSSGIYVKGGVKRAIAQKTVVIPGKDGLYVLQLNADAVEGLLPVLMDATATIDQQTTITP